MSGIVDALEVCKVKLVDLVVRDQELVRRRATSLIVVESIISAFLAQE